MATMEAKAAQKVKNVLTEVSTPLLRLILKWQRIYDVQFDQQTFLVPHSIRLCEMLELAVDKYVVILGCPVKMIKAADPKPTIEIEDHVHRQSCRPHECPYMIVRDYLNFSQLTNQYSLQIAGAMKNQTDVAIPQLLYAIDKMLDHYEGEDKSRFPRNWRFLCRKNHWFSSNALINAMENGNPDGMSQISLHICDPYRFRAVPEQAENDMINVQPLFDNFELIYVTSNIPLTRGGTTWLATAEWRDKLIAGIDSALIEATMAHPGLVEKECPKMFPEVLMDFFEAKLETVGFEFNENERHLHKTLRQMSTWKEGVYGGQVLDQTSFLLVCKKGTFEQDTFLATFGFILSSCNRLEFDLKAELIGLGHKSGLLHDDHLLQKTIKTWQQRH